MERLGFVKKSSSLTSAMLPKRKRNQRNNKRKNKPKKINQRNNRKRNKKKKNKKKMFIHSWLHKLRRKILLTLFQNLTSTLTISREISLMLKIEKPLLIDSGLLMILKDGVFGNQITNCTKEKVKSDIWLATWRTVSLET